MICIFHYRIISKKSMIKLFEKNSERLKAVNYLDWKAPS